MNKSLCQQLAYGLKDPSHGISARSILNQQPDIQFASFRSDSGNILGCHICAVRAKGTLCNATMAPESPETLVPAKCQSQGIVIPASSKFMIPNSLLVNVYTAIPNWTSCGQQSRAKLLPKLSVITLWSKQWLCAPK